MKVKSHTYFKIFPFFLNKIHKENLLLSDIISNTSVKPKTIISAFTGYIKNKQTKNHITLANNIKSNDEGKDKLRKNIHYSENLITHQIRIHLKKSIYK